MILAEIGNDRSRFGSAARLASWAGVCPGHDESAGKRRRGHTRNGNRDLRRVLEPCAWAARNTSMCLGLTCRRLEARIGGTKAAMTVAHKLLVIVYHLLAEGTLYDEDRYHRLSPQQEEHQRRRAEQALQALGYRVTCALVG
jgi:transposase